MAGRKNLMAVNKAVKAAGLQENGIDAPMVELLRTLARQMDAAGAEPPARLLQAYLSVTKDLRRASAPRGTVRITAPPPPTPPADVAPTGPVAVEESPLEKLRKLKKRSA